MSECLGDQTMVDLVEGTLAPSERARVEAHASNCDACRALLSSLARDSAIAALAPTDPILARPEKLAVGAKIGRYLVKRMLGAGGMGMVYAAHDPELDRGVAIKLLRTDVADPAAKERMQGRLKREAQAMAQLAHPNVVAVYDVGAFGDQIFVAMEYIDGQTLSEWLVAKPRTHAEILAMFVAAGRGLAAAHAEGLVHRDFKPENCVVGDDDRVRVLDFGLALSIGEGAPRTPLPLVIAHAIEAAGTNAPLDLTRTGTVVGTPYYMSPEQYRGEDADARSDQFSFCVALYSALYDQRPFRGETFDALATAVLSGKVVPPPAKSRVMPHVRAAIARGMAHEPEDRYPTMDAFLAALTTPPRRSRWWIAPAVIGVVGLGVGGVLLAARDTPVVAVSARCVDLAAQRAETWSPERRAKLRDHLVALAPGMHASHDRALAAADRFATAWDGAREAACKPAVPREAVLACLGTRLRALGEAARLVGERQVEYAVSAVHAMRGLEPPLAECALVEDPTSDALAVRRAAELRQRLAEIDVQLALGDLDRAQKAIAPLAVDPTLEPTLAAEVVELAVRIADARPALSSAAPPILIPGDGASKQLDAVKLLDDDRATLRVRAQLAVARVRHLGYLGRAHEARWQRDEAMRELAAIDGREGARLRGLLALHLAEAALALRAPGDALVDLATAGDLLAEEPELLLRVHRLRARAGEGDALAAAEQLGIATYGPHHPEVGAILEQRGEPAQAAALYAMALGLANRWRGPALTAQAQALEAAGDHAEALALYEEVDRIDDALGYRDALASANQLRLAAAQRYVDREVAYRTLSRPPRPAPAVALPARAYARPLRQSHEEALVRARIQMEVAWVRLGKPAEPPPGGLPSGTTLFAFARSSVESARTSRGATVFTSGRFVLDLDSQWHEDWLLGEIELGLGKPALAAAALRKARGMADPGDPLAIAIDAALGRATGDRAMVEAALARMDGERELVWAAERARQWLAR